MALSPYHPVLINIKGSTIESNNCEKLLGIYIDSNLLFEYHINRICRKASQKLHGIGLQNAFPKIKNVCYSQFNYCPIV